MDKNYYANAMLEQIFAGTGVDGSAGQQCWMCWGANSPEAFDECEEYRAMMVFSVNGMKLKGHVEVCLTWADVYKVAFVNAEGKTVHEVDEVYFDNLTECIDRHVEYTGAFYHDDVDAWLAKTPLC